MYFSSGTHNRSEPLRLVIRINCRHCNRLLTHFLGVVSDDDYVPNLPGKLFEQGRSDRTLSVMTGHNQDEGSLFIPNTLVTNETSYAAFLRSLIPQLAHCATDLNYITKGLYPPVFDGSQGFTNQVERNNLTFADMALVCNARFMDQAGFHPTTYTYEYSAPPPVHGADLSYTFYDFGPVAGVNTTLAEIMQGYLIRFAETGHPNAPALPPLAAARRDSPCRIWESLWVRCRMRGGSSSCRSGVGSGRMLHISLPAWNKILGSTVTLEKA